MDWEEFVDWLRVGVHAALMLWQMAVISVIVAVLLCAPIALLQLLCKYLAGA
nr:MAG TPA: hypothetical protein [Caudoviricetes sp.]